MKETNAINDHDRFRTGAAKYAEYLETPEGKLRLDVAFDNLREFLPPTAATLHALDIGGGTGDMAVRLARLGVRVTILDDSPDMLEFAEHAAKKAEVTERVSLKHGDTAQLTTLFSAGSFDLILCHNVLEYVDDPVFVLKGAAQLLRDVSSVISILVRNQAGEVLKAAIQEGDLSAAELNLSAEWANESLYGGKVRLFSSESLHSMLKPASLAVVAERGVRVVSDYLPTKISRENEYEHILELERELGRRQEFAAMARYSHVICHREGSATEAR